MEKNLYRDEINYDNEPTQIEHDLAVYENEVSRILKEKFLSGRDIIITEEEDAKLKLFFAIMGIRAKATFDLFGKQLTISSKKYYKYYQKNNNFLDFLKRNLGFAVKCRSIQEVLNHPQIDEPFRIFLTRDSEGYLGTNFAVVESREADAFVIGDCYPVIITGEPNALLPIPGHIYSIFPISANRTILLMEHSIVRLQQFVRGFRECILRQPIYNPDTHTIKIRVKSLYPEEVQFINTLIIENAIEGFVFRKPPMDYPTLHPKA